MIRRVERKKEKKQINKKNRILVLCFILFSIYFVYTFFEQQIQINKYDSQIEMYNAEIASKNELAKYYKEQSKNISTDEYIEQVARESLGYVKPYEKVFIDTNK